MSQWTNQSKSQAYGKSQTHPYEEILHRKRPEKKHPAMDLNDRAKIFSPFAALTGHGDAILAMQEVRENRKLLSESEQEALNQKLRTLEKGDTLTLVHFQEDPGSDGSGNVAEGRYVTASGILKKMDLTFGILYFDDGREIKIKELYEIIE